MEKELNVTLTVKVNAILDDPEAAEQTVRFLVEEDLRDKGWDADVTLDTASQKRRLLMQDPEKVVKGLEWILENDRFGFGTNWDNGEPQADEERAGKYIWDAITLLKMQERTQQRGGESMTLSDTIGLMQSEDWKDRFKAEYAQTKIRYEKLHELIIRREVGKLDFDTPVPLESWTTQAQHMCLYLRELEKQAVLHNIPLPEV